MHLTNSPFTYGDRAKFFGAIVIIDGQSSEGLDHINVRFASDTMRAMTFPVLITNLRPISATEEPNANATIH
jgi:hypothetical protein